MTKRRSTTSWRRQRGSFAVWPVKSHHQMPIKSCPKMILLEKWKLLEPLQKLWAVGQNNYCHRIWKVAKSGINRPIWSHWSFAKVNWPTRLIPYILIPTTTLTGFHQGHQCSWAPAVWPDWAIFCTVGNHSNPVATIILPKLPTVLGNCCKGVKIIHSDIQSI